MPFPQNPKQRFGRGYFITLVILRAYPKIETQLYFMLSEDLYKFSLFSFQVYEILGNLGLPFEGISTKYLVFSHSLQKICMSFSFF
jgi:hypothetical protein